MTAGELNWQVVGGKWKVFALGGELPTQTHCCTGAILKAWGWLADTHIQGFFNFNSFLEAGRSLSAGSPKAEDLPN